MDTFEFRNALGQFATGVTVITTTDEAGQPVGVTASSFNSVSLDPPLVLWSLAKNSGSLAAYQHSGHFCVHVLASKHEAISGQFASKGTDKFQGVDWQKGELGSPLLPEFAARFQCKLTYQYEGGDHVIFVGEVIDFETRDEAPLVFHKGRYATASVNQQVELSTLKNAAEHKETPGQAVDTVEGRFSENFFLYLLSRAHYQASFNLHQELLSEGIGTSEYLSLTILGLAGQMSYQDLHARLEHTGNPPSQKTLQVMLQRRLITETADAAKFALTVKGRNLYIRLLSVSKATEENLLAGFDADEIAEVRSFLHRFIEKSDPGVPPLWGDE